MNGVIVLNRAGERTVVPESQHAAWLDKHDHRTKHDWACGGGCYGVIISMDTAWVISGECPTHRGQIPTVPIVSAS